MSKFLNLTFDFQLYDSTTQSNDPADGVRLKNVMSDTGVTGSSRQTIALADEAADQEVALPADLVNWLIISTDQNISVSINGAADIELSPITAGRKATVYYARAEISSLTMSNDSGSTANVDIIAVVG